MFCPPGLQGSGSHFSPSITHGKGFMGLLGPEKPLVVDEGSCLQTPLRLRRAMLWFRLTLSDPVAWACHFAHQAGVVNGRTTLNPGSVLPHPQPPLQSFPGRILLPGRGNMSMFLRETDSRGPERSLCLCLLFRRSQWNQSPLNTGCRLRAQHL